MKPIIISLLLFFLSSFASAEQSWIEKSEALDTMYKHMKKDYIDYYTISEIHLVYPYGHGVPSYLAYFKAKTQQSTFLVLIRVNAISGKVCYKSEWEFESHKDIAKQFLDTSFVINKFEEETGQCVATLQLLTCGDGKPLIDCLEVPSPFWQIFTETGEEYLLDYYYMSGWYINKASDLRAKFFRTHEPFIEGRKQ